MFARRGDSEKPHLDWRVRLFLAGALLAMVGMGMGLPWLVWIAVAFLLLGFIVRYLPDGAGEGAGAVEDGDLRDGELSGSVFPDGPSQGSGTRNGASEGLSASE